VSGHLYGVGLGPGDPELVTVKASRLIGAADVVAYHRARNGASIARSIAEPHIPATAIEEVLTYPVTTEATGHPGGYQGAVDEFYTEAATRLAAHLDAGRDVVLLCAGDPLLYGSYMHMHKRLAPRYPTTVVPGVSSITGAAAALGAPLAERDEVFTVLPGTLPPAELAGRLTETDSAAVLKLGRTFPGVREALAAAGRLDEAWYVERASREQERIEPLAEVDPASVPYFSLAVLPSRAAVTPEAPESGSVSVVGLGPGERQWVTPEASAVLAGAADLVGYGPYLDRLPARTGQRKHPSGNRVEAERAEFALELAARGRRVAVVSSGDPGVFAMAAALIEAAGQERYAGTDVRVHPGVTAAQAVAARAGAPLGHDYCVLSLSDRLKPWGAIEARLRAAAVADLVLALYNPASASRTWQLSAARDLLLEYRRPDTPVVAGRDVGGPRESLQVVRLAELDTTEVDMRCLLIVGSSTTCWERGRVFTPRRYPA
jgi:precorrin-2 C20-methyltransferase/precorrin-3B C17-methyltransferase